MDYAQKFDQPPGAFERYLILNFKLIQLPFFAYPWQLCAPVFEFASGGPKRPANIMLKRSPSARI